MYIKRQMEEVFLKASDFFKAVLLTGPRQVGKTTMLKELSKNQNREYVSLDDLRTRHMAKVDPAMFFQIHKPPLLIDEIQRAPELFPYIKIICDNTDKKGSIWMTGSQSYQMMRTVSESLAGRVGILNLYGFSSNEINGIKFKEPICFEADSLINRCKQSIKTDISDIFSTIYTGGMPSVIYADALERKLYFDSYVNTYLMRDAMEDGGISDSVKFRRFLTVCASLNGQLLNYATISDSCGISQPTAKSWIEVLEGMNIIFLLKPYFNNKLKSTIKTPKLYFYDTGLASYLAEWSDKDKLMFGPMAGAFFENYCILELVKGQIYNGNSSENYFYRDRNTREIDFLYMNNNKIYPIEIKKTSSPNKSMAKNFIALKADSPWEIGNGIILCCTENLLSLDNKLYAVPVSSI